MDFAAWLQNELQTRRWIQADLLESAKSRGYALTSPQLSRILSREQQAGIDSVIAIAHGLGLPRESVFRARGWLSADTLTPDYHPDAEMLRLMQDMDTLPPALRGAAFGAMRAMVDALLATTRKGD